MKVLLIDDHPLILSALKAVVQGFAENVRVQGVETARQGPNGRLQLAAWRAAVAPRIDAGNGIAYRRAGRSRCTPARVPPAPRRATTGIERSGWCE